MVFPFIMVLACVCFGLQLIFCFKAKRRWVRFAPVLVTALADLLCWGLYLGGAYAEVYGAAFAFYIYGIVLLMILGAELAALGIYILVKYIQKRRK